MRFKFKGVFTPKTANRDRRRIGTIVENVLDPIEAIKTAVAALDLSTEDVVVAAYLEQSKEDDTSEGFIWSLEALLGTWVLEIVPFESTDPVTEQSILDWAKEQSDDIQDVLAGVMCRVCYRNIQSESDKDAKEALYDIMSTDGFKPYAVMGVYELATTLLEEVVEHEEDMYNDLEQDRPFGLSSMVEENRKLWFGEE